MLVVDVSVGYIQDKLYSFSWKNCRFIGVVIMSGYSTFCGLNLAAVHAQGKWVLPFPVCPGIERRSGDFLVVEFGLVK